MMAQYRRIKTELPKDALLLFRLGDFYELFFEDAIEGAQILNVALTRRGVIPMCGIPFHAAERNNFLAALNPIGKRFGLAVVDLTTGDFKVTELSGEAALETELERL